MNAAPKLPCGDDALMRQTGRDWAAWRALLDADGAAKLSHIQIVTIVNDKYNGGPWWSQMITVGYERLHGLRMVSQSRGGVFAISASRTLPIAAATAHHFFVDATARQSWLGEAVSIRTSIPPKSLRMTWPDGSIVAVVMTAKGDQCSVGIEHGKLPDEAIATEMKAWWKEALGRLHAVVRPA